MGRREDRRPRLQKECAGVCIQCAEVCIAESSCLTRRSTGHHWLVPSLHPPGLSESQV